MQIPHLCGHLLATLWVVCADKLHDGNEVMERVTELVEQSLIELADSGGAELRVRMLDTIRK